MVVAVSAVSTSSIVSLFETFTSTISPIQKDTLPPQSMVGKPISQSTTASMFPLLQQHNLDKEYAELMERLKSALSTSALHELIHQIDLQTNNIDSDLLRLVTVGSKKHMAEISLLELSRAKLSGAIANSNDLTKVFTSANDLGHSLTSRIKALDREISNVNSTLLFVSDVQLLKNNISQTQYAIEKGDWDLAANCIHIINHKLSPKLVNGKFALVTIPSSEIPELPAPTVKKWTEQLTQEFQTRFNDAAKARSVPEITKYFQLFPLIDQEEAGLQCYSKFICSIITDTSRTLINSATKGEARLGIYATVTQNLFESISTMLSLHTPLINKYYGTSYPDAVVFVVSKIQREIDSQIGLIADTFYDVNRVDKTLQDIKLHKFTELSRRFSDHYQQPEHEENDVYDHDIVPLVEIGDLIHEFSSILHHWSLYCKFISAKYLSKSQSQQDVLEVPQLLSSSHFNKKIHNKFLPAFEALYTYYLRRSFEKAITIEEVPDLDAFLVTTAESKAPDQPAVSSVVEDLSLIFHNTLRNILESSQPSTVKHFVTECFKVLRTDFLDGFIRRALQDNLPRYNKTLSLISAHSTVLSGSVSPSVSRSGTPAPESVSGYFKGASSAFGNIVGTGSSMVTGSAGGQPNEPKLVNYVVYLNTVATAQQFIHQIVENTTQRDPQYIKNNFPFGMDGDRIKNIIRGDILEPFTAATNDVVRQSLRNFYNQSMKNRLASIVNEAFSDHNDTRYMAYSSTILNDPSSMIKFKNSWGSMISPYRQTMHKTLVFNKLLRLLVVNLASMIEKRLMVALKKFKINELGALKLDKDVLFIINEVCEDDYELREKFVRLTQLVLLVGMDEEEYQLNSFSKLNEEEEDEEEDNDVGINWVLTPLERKQIRRFRC